MTDNYILDSDGKTPVPCPDLLTWGKAMEGRRIVTQTDLPNGKWVSTVFLGLDHSYGEGPPLLFETMVFPKKGNWEEEACRRYSTWDEAVAGHKELVKEWSAK